MENKKVYEMRFSKVYPLLVNKAVRKGRTRADVDSVTAWLTGYTAEQLEMLAESDITYRAFFENAPFMNEKRFDVKGSVCGVKIDEIKEPLMRDIRVLDKLVDELAKGKSIEKILPVNH